MPRHLDSLLIRGGRSNGLEQGAFGTLDTWVLSNWWSRGAGSLDTWVLSEF